jgi:transcriptional regulator with XRE-family HTH domain
MKKENPIRRYRRSHGLSTRGLAALLGVSAMAVSRWEREEREIEAALLPRIVEVTGIDPALLRPDLAPLFKS